MGLPKKILIIGAGPTGLGAAWRLQEAGHPEWQLREAASVPGGLSLSVCDAHGFTWDLGGHVLFSHYEYFDRVMDDLLGPNWVEHIRESWVWIRDRFIPYPLQNNIRGLPVEDLSLCLKGLLAIHGKAASGSPPENFKEWILQHFGTGLADVFMLPYNRKVWAYEPDQLSVGWMGERVSAVDLGRILENIIRQKDDVSWGPNHKFRFPLRGGTGAIWQACWNRLSQQRLHLKRSVQRIDMHRKVVRLGSGEEFSYDALISTMPLEVLLRITEGCPEVSQLAPDFRYSSSHIFGIGIEGTTPESLQTKCWMYFPEPELPFYRVTVFSNYSPNNVPQPGKYWSLMCEVSESPEKPVDSTTILSDVISGCRHAQLIPSDSRIVSTWSRRLEHGYPTPFVGRDELLGRIRPILEQHSIFSRGRFGAWKYEVSNQDHSFMQGVEVVDRLLRGWEETTLEQPSVVNSRRNPIRSI